MSADAPPDVVVVDVGVATPTAPAAGLLDRNVRRGTADLAVGPAMTLEEARRAVEVGIEVATTLAADHGCLVTGDMGITNTTASAALVCAGAARALQDVATFDSAGVTGKSG
jgi:nicotinate-nucleotide--dimethylbenzimidazole phosphoribosyltransferase